MSRPKLLSARDYFEEVLTPAKDRFLAEEASFLLVSAAVQADCRCLSPSAMAMAMG